MRVVAGECLKHLRHVNIGLVADGKDAGERQGAAGEGEVAGDVARLGDDGDAAVDGFHAMLVGPEGGAGEAVDEAVAVGAHQRHAVRCREQLLLEVGIARFGEARWHRSRRRRSPFSAVHGRFRWWVRA